jgi:hypothetical protein
MTVTPLEEIQKKEFAISCNQEKEYGDLEISEIVQNCCHLLLSSQMVCGNRWCETVQLKKIINKYFCRL